MIDDSYAWKEIGTFSRNCLLSLKSWVKWMEFRPVAQDVAPKSFNLEAIFCRIRCLSMGRRPIIGRRGGHADNETVQATKQRNEWKDESFCLWPRISRFFCTWRTPVGFCWSAPRQTSAYLRQEDHLSRRDHVMLDGRGKMAHWGRTDFKSSKKLLDLLDFYRFFGLF